MTSRRSTSPSFTGDEGVLFVGKAQEKASVFRTEKRRRPDGSTYPWIYRSTTPVNHYYVYLLDRDFGPLFIKFCSYFPYAVKVCLNGHEWLKRQLTQRGIAYEPLDNGIRSTEDPARVQRIANTLDAPKIDAVFRKWLRRLPHPFTAAHRAAGYRYQLSILQAEFALTQVLDRPRTGRGFFEEVMRENLDLGRPDQMQLDFQSPRHAANARPVPHPHPHRRRRPLAPRRLQEIARQAVPQRRPGAPHRNHHQQHLRLRDRSGSSQSARPAGDRLCRQPTPLARRIPEPRLPDRRRPPRRPDPTHRRRHATRRGAPRRRSPRARPDADALSLCAQPHRLSPSGRAHAHRAVPRPRPRSVCAPAR